MKRSLRCREEDYHFFPSPYLTTPHGGAHGLWCGLVRNRELQHRKKANIVRALSGPEIAYSKISNTKIQTDGQGNFLGVFSKDKNGKDVVMSPAGWNTRILNTYPAKDLPENKIDIEQLQLNRAIQETWNGIIQF